MKDDIDTTISILYKRLSCSITQTLARRLYWHRGSYCIVQIGNLWRLDKRYAGLIHPFSIFILDQPVINIDGNIRAAKSQIQYLLGIDNCIIDTVSTGIFASSYQSFHDYFIESDKEQQKLFNLGKSIGDIARASSIL